MRIEDILSKIPDYQTFFTVDELDKQVRILELEYPQVVKVTEIGNSRNGHPILCMKIGEGKKNALCFGCPHPNEPIGAMTLITMARLFADDSELLKETGFTWYLIPCIDPDGTKLNEPWFKGPFNLTNYVYNFYRPTGDEQVEWTFPFEYKGISFNNPIPETKLLMNLIDELKPSFLFSLHNTAFGGAYWYLSDNIPQLCSQLENAAARQNVPLQLGEPEAAYITKFSPAVHSSLSIKKHYDYLEKYGGGITNLTANSGATSFDYVNTVCKCISMMAELPYFSNPCFEDLSKVDKSRRESAYENIRFSEKHYKFLKSHWAKISNLFSDDNPFPKFVGSCIEGAEISNRATRKLLENSEFDRQATVSEWFDNLYGARIYECLNLALTIRACDFELVKNDCKNRATLADARKAINIELVEMCGYLETNVEYEVISIKKLVSIQTESALLVAKHISKNW